ncbi:MAG: nuclear transport factor 2 family protein [Phycisphaerales bacterium]|jgi:ketosteroid isomerase-like protein|nr:nuclear transport factor 2 family protein [Phycisphaerales bacterium]MDB5356358.1 nuclear transport factor 2 family protein [Phycisphaerales bacterium]
MSASTKEVAHQLVDLCKKGEHLKAVQTLYSKDIVSVEPMAHPPMPAESKGIQAVLGKNEWWLGNHTIHSGTTTGPYVNGDKFIVEFEMDVTQKPTGKRIQMRETGLYTVADGKVVREEFFYLEG